ncbi:MAG: PIN domain-containing protein [Deltaproteobacteria bacterium]|nr:PIN domain-containing protein [Deltaproteobacteria bacterium]
MSVTKAFLDTNILIYIFSEDQNKKREQAISRINSYKRYISTQVLTEFCSIGIRKLKMDHLHIEVALNELCLKNGLLTVDVDTIKLGLHIQNKYHYSYYDSLIIASALESNCDYLLSEDMNNGQVIEKSLTILNIFDN